MFKSKHPLFFATCEYFSLLARIGNKKGSLWVIDSIEELSASSATENLKAGLEKSFKLIPQAPLVTICSVAPLNRFIHRVKLDLKVKKQGVGGFGALLKERFNIELPSHKVAVLDADTGENIDVKNLPDNVCFVGAPKKEFTEAQAELLKHYLYPQRMFLTTLDSLSGLIHYASLKKVTAPILYIEISLNKSHIFILKDKKIEASYPLVYGLKNFIQAARKDYNLPDDVSAHKYLTNDVKPDSDEAQKLVSRMVAELKSYVGFFEVQCGTTIGNIFFNQLPPTLGWIEQGISKLMGIETLEIDYQTWLKSKGLMVKEGLIKDNNLPKHLFNVFSLMMNYF